ncbi:MAG: hypothetical protein WCF57_17670 [Pyrinomonadaceae bacterium]
MITRQVEHPHVMAMALVVALSAISSVSRPRERDRASLEVTLESMPIPALGSERGSTRWCATCGAGFRMVTPLAATALADISFHRLYRWAETEEIHFSVTAEGSLFVCLDSLLERVSA